MVEAARNAVMRQYELEHVVVRESAARAWFNRHILRLYYPPSMVSQQSATERWIDTKVKNELPLLHHFEVHLTDHCNLNCKGCFHFSNLCKPNFADLDSYRSDLEAMAQKLRVTQMRLMGGEPLLHPQVNDFMRVTRECLPDTRICVLTNGILVTKMPPEFWETLAETNTMMLCDAYPIGLPVDEINALAEKYGVELEWTDDRNLFFNTPIDLEGKQDPALEFRRCSGISNCPNYRNGRLYPCARIAYIDAFEERFGITGMDGTEADSISIRDSTSAEIWEFMTHPVPWCRFCDYDHFYMYEWDRTERSIEEWTNSEVV
jgi:hypothetical protein